MKNDCLGVNVLSMKVIFNVDLVLVKELLLKLEYCLLGIVIFDCDDVIYVVLDEVIKVVDVIVVYGKSMYVGVVNVLIKLVGEVIGIIVGLSFVEVNSGLSVIM